MDIIYEIIKLLIITYVLVDLGAFLGEIIADYSSVKNKFLKLVILVLSYILTCPKCASFWISLVLSGNLFTAALISILINIIKEAEHKFLKTKI